MSETEPESTPRRSHAGTVAAGILSSRIFGLAREAIVLYFFGIGAHTDVFQAAFRAPNLLQNLLGEGTISAAFIPIYSRMLEEGRADDAGRFAGAVFGLLVAVMSVLVLLGITLARPIVSVLVFGWVNDAALVAAGALSINRFELTVQAVRIIFPMTGVLVLSAWALGILNSHRRFFVPYFAPVLWNIAIISALFVGASLFLDAPASEPGGVPAIEALNRLLFAAFFGALIGGIMQFLVQVPQVVRVMKGFRLSFSTKVEGVRAAMAAFGPAVAGRGVSQLSGYLDLFLASLLATGALASLRPALMLYLLPVSLFGLSVAASELPELSRISEEQIRPFLDRLNQSIRQSLFLTIPTAIGYLGLGFLIVGALYRRGTFGVTDNWLVYTVLGGYSLGLVATTISRLLQNGFWALRDTKTPAKIAVVRVAISAAVALPLMFLLDRFSVTQTLGMSLAADEQPLFFGAAGLALGASVAAWIELWRLRISLRKRLESFRLPWASVLKMSGLAIAAMMPAALLWWLLPAWSVLVVALLVVGVYGVTYLALAYLLHLPELNAWTGRFIGRFRKES